jgi:Xaa-Pro aminopeptidase
MLPSGERRIERLADALGERGADRLIVSAAANLRYLTGYTGTNGLAVIAAAGTDAEHLFLTDFRYETQAAQEVGAHAPSCERVIATGELVQAAAKLLGGGRPQRIGFDEHDLSVARHERLRETLGVRFELVACGGMVERLREVKEEDEQQRIAAAAELADQALGEILEWGLVGRSEREIAITLETRMRTLGAQAPSFPSIVASGAHGALPHAQPREREIEAGTLVCIDWGCVLEGYCSDCTRTYAAGPVGAHQQEIYEIVLASQLAGLGAVLPGRSGRKVDEMAREVIEAAGYGERFGHGLGHGVGMEIHEEPRLSRTASDEPLQVGNVVTVEPGIYLPEDLGVRIEDLVVVSADSPRILSSLPKELTVI